MIKAIIHRQLNMKKGGGMSNAGMRLFHALLVVSVLFVIGCSGGGGKDNPTVDPNNPATWDTLVWDQGNWDEMLWE
jgi:hypothetical protein